MTFSFTLSIGRVHFHLTPTTEEGEDHAAVSSTTSPRRTTPPPPSSSSSSSPSQQQTPPLVSVRRRRRQFRRLSRPATSATEDEERGRHRRRLCSGTLLECDDEDGTDSGDDGCARDDDDGGALLGNDEEVIVDLSNFCGTLRVLRSTLDDDDDDGVCFDRKHRRFDESTSRTTASELVEATVVAGSAAEALETTSSALDDVDAHCEDETKLLATPKENDNDAEEKEGISVEDATMQDRRCDADDHGDDDGGGPTTDDGDCVGGGDQREEVKGEGEKASALHLMHSATASSGKGNDGAYDSDDGDGDDDDAWSDNQFKRSAGRAESRVHWDRDVDLVSACRPASADYGGTDVPSSASLEVDGDGRSDDAWDDNRVEEMTPSGTSKRVGEADHVRSKNVTGDRERVRHANKDEDDNVGEVWRDDGVDEGTAETVEETVHAGTTNDHGRDDSYEKESRRRRGALFASAQERAGCPSSADGGRSLALGSSSATDATPLHVACASPRSTVDGVRSILRSDPAAASVRDGFGRVPLHVLAQNESLASHWDEDGAASVVRDLIDADPNAMLMPDVDGRVPPFASALVDWIGDVHDDAPTFADMSASLSSFASLSLFRRINSNPLADLPSSERRKLLSFPSGIEMRPHALWSLRMLSHVVDHLERRSRRRHDGGTPLVRPTLVHDENLRCREAVIEAFASIPYLCKTILLLSDYRSMEGIVQTSIMRNVLLNQKSIGPWLVAMFHGNKFARSRAVDFLERLSSNDTVDETEESIGRSDKSILFAKQRQEVFDAVANIHGLVPSMLGLGKRRLERASVTPAVQYILDKQIRKPVTMSLFWVDFWLSVMLLIGYRMTVIRPFLRTEDNFYDNDALFYLVASISVYFILKRILTAFYLAHQSWKLLVRSLKGPWVLAFDVLAVSLALATSTALHSSINMHDNIVMANMSAVTLGLLWARLIIYLKSMNKELATYILAISDIIVEIRWFLLILYVAIISFADAVDLITMSSGECEDTFSDTKSSEQDRMLDAAEDFCSPEIRDSYLRIYAILVGDVQLDDYLSPSSIALHFVLFTFFSLIVLLNVLIAIVEDCYEKSKYKSRLLFGQARVEFVAAQMAQESFFLRPASPQERTAGKGGRHRIMVQAFRWCTILAALSALSMIELFFVLTIVEWMNADGQSSEVWRNLQIMYVVCAVVLNWGLLAMVYRIFVRPKMKEAPLHCLQKLGVEFLIDFPLMLVTKLLGIGGPGHSEKESNIDPTSDWYGRTHYLEQRTKTMIETAEKHIVTEIKNAERAWRQRRKAKML